ncbi:MAG: PAS domain-containing protein [Phycisphaerae bacterium]|nr:PAS domain-containing protein [Phycisphaerae bacterium]
MISQPDDPFFRQLCTHAAAGIIAADEQLCIRFANAAASRILGLATESIVGQPISSLVPAERQAVAQRLFERALHQGETSDFEFCYRDSPDHPVYLAVSISPVIDDPGERVGIALHIRDVTRRVQAMKTQAHDAKMASLGTLAGAVAHYFGNLLGGLVPTADFALSQDNPEALRRALRSIATTLTQTGRLTQGLRAFAEGIHAIEADECLSTIVQRFADDWQPRLAKRGIDLETSLQPVAKSLPPHPVMVVLENIATNACEAMPQGGKLRFDLATDADGRSVFLRIGDNGPGISEGDLPHVFEPFYTAITDTVRAGGEHLGLGLAVVHGIVRCLGGTVTLCSSAKDGTICSLQFPCDPPNESTAMGQTP